MLKNKEPGQISEGKKRKEPKSSRTGNIESLKIGTESRGNHSLCSGLEPHHPIMSKLWNLGGQNQRKKERKIKNICPYLEPVYHWHKYLTHQYHQVVHLLWSVKYHQRFIFPSGTYCIQNVQFYIIPWSGLC